VASPNGEKSPGTPTTAEQAKARKAQAKQEKQAAEDAYKSKITASTVINLATTDVERFQPDGDHSHYLFLCPLEIAAFTW
jgi:hypothetical protein